MARYSTSRGMMYTAPPTAEEETEPANIETQSGKPATAGD